MRFALTAAVFAFLCAMQSALAAKTPPKSLPSGVKRPSQAQKTYAPPVMNAQRPKAASPVEVESAFEQGSESAAVQEEPEAELPEAPAGNALPAPAMATRKPLVVKKKEVEIEEDEDGEVEIEAKIKLEPAPRSKAAPKRPLADDDYVFTDEELGIASYMKTESRPEPVEEQNPGQKPAAPADELPLVDLPAPLDGYSPEYQESKLEESLPETEGNPADTAENESTMVAESKPPGSLEFDMDTVGMLSDSLEPTGEVRELAKRK